MTATDVRPFVQRSSERARRERRRRRVRRSVIVLVLAVVLVAVWAVGWSRYFSVSSVEVVTGKRTSAAEVRQVARVPLGRPLLKVRLRAIAHRVAQLPTVADVDVRQSWPHTVRIVVTDRVPVAVVMRAGQPRLIDASGVDFANASPGAPYPHVGLDMTDATPQEVSAALSVAQTLPVPLLRTTTQIAVFDPTDMRLDLKSGATVFWGGPSDVALKARVLAALQRLHPSARTFDVSAPTAPTVTP
ncbi:MAG TPA: FtsQ-type POTRA domain-containing protein [Actinomycetes bacterium]|nr:FtsQ-type POTRA domain-containing protein [Actinomycetes bacterium]